MNMRLFTTFIPMLALIVFFVWGWLEGTYEHCWIVFLVAGGLMAFLPSYQRYRDKDKYNKEKDDTDE